MGRVTQMLGRIAYEFDMLLPMIPTYLHLIVSALLPIYAGAHASLSRPSSAAKPKKKGRSPQGGETEEPDSIMMAMTNTDAITFPIFAGMTLASLYFLIKWLQDPAILSKILNWYFSGFSILAITKLAYDSANVFKSVIFPSQYALDGQIWYVDPEQKQAILQSNPLVRIDSPLPGRLSRLKLGPKTTELLWASWRLASKRIDVRAHVHGIFTLKTLVDLQGLLSFIIAVAAVFFYNFVAASWWLTNIQGLAMAYNSLQLMSPGSFGTGNLILASLLVYDVYMVFFTPLMVTVATKIDIPAKLLFPRPLKEHDDPKKQPMSMLGLGDVILPGIMIGLALRFDLYLFYLRKQKRKSQATGDSAKNSAIEEHTDNMETPAVNFKDASYTDIKTIAPAENSISKDNASNPFDIVKAPWRTATGFWGERYWTRGVSVRGDMPAKDRLFPKTYFHASIFGYIVGMLSTIAVMHIYDQGQPALLYLVPGVLISTWGTALLNGDLKVMWNYNEEEDGDEPSRNAKPDAKDSPSKNQKQGDKQKPSSKWNLGSGIWKWSKQMDDAITAHAKAAQKKTQMEAQGTGKTKTNQKIELFAFSITLPPPHEVVGKPQIKQEKLGQESPPQEGTQKPSGEQTDSETASAPASTDTLKDADAAPLPENGS